MLDQKDLIWRGGTVIDATIIESTTSTKNSTGGRGPEIRQTGKGNQWHHRMKTHIGVDAGTELVRSATFTAANAANITEAHRLIREDNGLVCADAGHTGVAKRPEIVEDDHLSQVEYRVSGKIGKRKKMRKGSPGRRWMAVIEGRKSAVRSGVEHAFRILKNQSGYMKTACRGNGNSPGVAATCVELPCGLRQHHDLRVSMFHKAHEVRTCHQYPQELHFNSAIITFFPVLLGSWIVWNTPGIAESLTRVVAIYLLGESERRGTAFA